MKLKNNNMLVAGDFFEQTKTLYPESTDSYELTMKSRSLYSDITKEISALNDDFRFDYSAFPALTITDKDSNVLAFAVHPSLRKEHIGEFGSASGVFNSAFENSKLFDDVSKAISIAGGDVAGFSIRQDLGEFQDVAKGMFRAVLNKTDNVGKFQYLNDLYLPDDVLTKNYESHLENEAEEFKKQRESAFVMYGDKDHAVTELKDEQQQAKTESESANKAIDENVNPELVDDLNDKKALADEQLRIANEKIKARLEEENKVAAVDLNWHEERMKEEGFKFKVSKRPVYKGAFQNIQDVVVADENQNELYRFRTGFTPNVRISAAGLMNPAARSIAQEYMIRKGADPIRIRLPDLDSKSGMSNTELMTFMKSSVIEFHENFNVPFDRLRVPKSYQPLFDELVQEYEAKQALMTGYDVGPEQQEAPAHKPQSTVQPDATSAPAEPEQEPAEPVEKALPDQPEPSAPVAEKQAENAASVVADSKSAVSDPVADAPKAEPPEPVTETPKSPDIPVAQGLTLIESKKQAGKYSLWGKESFEHTEESVKKGTAALCKYFGIQPSDVVGQWMTADEKLSLNPKKSQGFLLARTVVAEMVNDAVLAEKAAVAQKEVVVDKPHQFDEFDLDAREQAIAESMGTPEVLDSPEQAERVAIRNGSKNESSTVDDEIDNEAALKEFDALMNELDKAKSESGAEPVSKKANINKLK